MNKLSPHSEETLNPQDLKLHELIGNLLTSLSEKEKYIIKNRFALESGKKTLEEIGQHYGVTRERVRQIEQSALRKLERSAQNTHLKILTEFAKALLEKEGGIATDDYFKNLLLGILPKITVQDLQELHLALSLESDIHFEPNGLKSNSYWRTSVFNEAWVKKASTQGIKILNKTKTPMDIDALTQKINEALESSFSAKVMDKLLHISKEYIFLEEGVGLYSWRHINPRTLRDKIHFIFKKENKPLHFEKVTELIREAKFDAKKINVQAVHNELIRNDSFILIGRGIYALGNWGYKTGTVSEVIAEILSDGTPRTREEITQLVLDQRHVKVITIYLNLKNKAQFTRVGRDKYTLLRFA